MDHRATQFMKQTINTILHRGRHVSYQRSKHALTHNTSLVKIDGVESTEAAQFYLGKKVAFVYRAKREVRGSNIRVIWGKVTRSHGMRTRDPHMQKSILTPTLQVTPVLSVPSSATTSLLSPLVPPSVSCSTPPTSKRHHPCI